MQDTPLVIIEDADALAKACEEMHGEPVLGIDTESDSMYCYQEKVCLIQVSDRKQDYIIDPLALKDLGPFLELLSDPNVVKVFHGADYDIVSLRRDFGCDIPNLFDTMVSSQILGLPKVGLADLVDRFFDVKLDKKFQRHNWAKRPLLPEHLDYARGDSHFLLPLRELLTHKLQSIGRLGIAEEEFDLLSRREWKDKPFDPNDFIRIKHSSGLEEVGLRVLRQLYVYRDGQAKEMNRPPYKVIPNQVLILIARKQPQKIEDLNAIVRSGSTMVRRHGPAMIEAVKRGLSDTEPLPSRKRESAERPPHGGRETERLFQKLKNWRQDLVSQQKLPLAMSASNNQLKIIAGWRPSDLQALRELSDIREWQVERYGKQWLTILGEFEASQEKPSRRNPRNRRRSRRGSRRGGDKPSSS
ncbi:MAG: HRDC domain-containing protein [Myxococcota bacterium]|nr:HRDC domain-containing protein [Myxococcota bacterium]